MKRETLAQYANRRSKISCFVCGSNTNRDYQRMSAQPLQARFYFDEWDRLSTMHIGYRRHLCARCKDFQADAVFCLVRHNQKEFRPIMVEYIKVDLDECDKVYYVLECSAGGTHQVDALKDVRKAEELAERLAKTYGCDWGCNY